MKKIHLNGSFPIIVFVEGLKVICYVLYKHDDNDRTKTCYVKCVRLCAQVHVLPQVI